MNRTSSGPGIRALGGIVSDENPSLCDERLSRTLASMASAKATSETGALRDLRRAKGLSQHELAERAGCSIAIVRLLEGGYHPQRSEVVPRLVAVLERDADAEVGSH
jgi:DNA-binding transcriptional regulator YiaG